MASGVSIMTHSAVAPVMISAARRTSPGFDTLGTRMAWGLAATAAAMSSIPQGVSRPFTRITSSRRP